MISTRINKYIFVYISGAIVTFIIVSLSKINVMKTILKNATWTLFALICVTNVYAKDIASESSTERANTNNLYVVSQTVSEAEGQVAAAAQASASISFAVVGSRLMGSASLSNSLPESVSISVNGYIGSTYFSGSMSIPAGQTYSSSTALTGNISGTPGSISVSMARATPSYLISNISY